MIKPLYILLFTIPVSINKEMNDFKEVLISKYNFSELEWNKTEKYFSNEMIEAKQHFVKQGFIASKLGFVESGLLRSHYIDENMRDITTQFFQPGQVVVVPRSFNENKPANENIVAYDDCELITITNAEFTKLIEEVPAWQPICKNVAEIKNQQLMDRTVQFQTNKAAERYKKFCEENPLIVLSVPLGHIASYLGIDIATLSRLRAKK